MAHACLGCLVTSIALVGFAAFTTPARAGDFAASSSREVREIRDRVRAAQFLSKATFGPTKPMIDSLAERIGQVGYRGACEEWIDDQFALPATSHEETAYEIVRNEGYDPEEPLNYMTEIGIYRTQAWWHIALTAEDQLRQRVAWALSQIFPVGDSGLQFNFPARYNIGNFGGKAIPLWAGLSNYYDKFVNQADGNYRELLEDVARHGIMGVWLSSIGNRKAVKVGDEIVQFPDENFAREIMQLFSVGLYELLPDGRYKLDTSGQLIPTYDNDDITEMARIFTGFSTPMETTMTTKFASKRFLATGASPWSCTRNTMTTTRITTRITTRRKARRSSARHYRRWTLDTMSSPTTRIRTISREMSGRYTQLPTNGPLRKCKPVWISFPITPTSARSSSAA